MSASGQMRLFCALLCRCSKPAKRKTGKKRSRWRGADEARSLAEFVGQQHFLGEGKLLRRLLEADRLGSVIFYGPPGTGKTTLAQLAGHGEPQPISSNSTPSPAA